MTGRREPPLELRATLAFGQPLRDGVELARERGKGTIVVLGNNADEKALLSGGDIVNQDVTDEAILRAAQDDCATILSAGLDRIIRKHAMLNPHPTIPASSRGSRHVTAERYARQTGRPVIAVSEERRTITLFFGDDQYRLRTKAELRDEINDLMWSLRALRDHVTRDDQVPPGGVDQARAALVLLDCHLVELGASGTAVKDECETIAATLGIKWSPSVVPHATPPTTTTRAALPVESIHNDFSGTAQNVVQAARIDAVYLPSAPVELPVPQQLPPTTPHFTDREAEVAHLVKFLSEDDTKPKIGVIVGAAGIGKSAFAVRCGQQVNDRFPDGVLYCDLRGFHPVAEPADPTDVLNRFLRDLGVPETAIPADLDGAIGLYRSRLHGRRLLIILDNARDAEQVRPLLPGTTTCGVLVTSRITMPSLTVREGAHLIKLEVLPSTDAITLLSRVTNGHADRPVLAELATLCGHHPLALCVAAARPADELEDFLNDLRLERLTPLSDPDDHAASVRAAFSLSYRTLPSTTQRTFRLLGLYPGPTISAQVAEVLCGDRDGVRRLLNTHLLEKAGRGYYRFHDLLRAYAMECATELEPADGGEAALRRVLDWLRQTAEAHDRVLDPWRTRVSPAESDTAVAVDRATASDWFDNEFANLAAATHAALTHSHYDLAWRLALAPSSYFYSRKPWSTWIATQEAGLSAARAAGAGEAEAWLCDGLGVAYREQGRHDDARRHFENALTRFHEIGNLVGEAETTLHLAQMYRERGELTRALQLSDTARSLFRSADARHGEAKASNLLGGIHLALGDSSTALAHIEQAVAIFAELGDEYSHSWAINNLATAFAKLGRRAEAISAFRTAMTVREQVDRYGLAFTLQGLGDVLHDDGDTAQARQHWHTALAIFDEIADPRAAQLRARLMETTPNRTGPRHAAASSRPNVGPPITASGESTGGSVEPLATATASAPVSSMDSAATRPRVLAEDRASLQAQSMPVVSRADLLRSALSQRDTHAHTAGRRQILALTGEGGIGKSVLLGQHLDQLDNDADRAVVLVACGNVPPGAELADLDSADTALGVAVDPKRGRDGLLRLLAEQREAHRAVTVLIDTVDLILKYETAVSIAVLLVEALDIGDVVMTCRTYEFTNYLRSIPRLAGRVTAFPMPSLDEPEIVAWAKRYLQDREQTADHSNFIESLSGLISASKSLQNVCSLPVRLALACATFADRGHLPENLTVTGLYEAYWDIRVNVHGTTKERAALQVARHVVTQSGQIALRVPKTEVDDELRHGLDSLISEGVLRDYGTEWEFFHQTFAEFAHARWALTHGIKSTAVSGLIEQAASGPANLWPVLASLLLQIRNFDDYQAVARKVPLTSADAVQTQTLGALQRDEPEALETLITGLAEQRELLLMTLPVLGDAPAQHIPVAVAGALDALRPDPSRPSRVLPKQASRAVDALSRLVPREATSADLFHEALLAVSALTKLTDGQRHGYLERLVKPFTTVRGADEKLAVLRATYPQLGPLGRRDAIRAHRLAGIPEKDFVSIARITMDYVCPPLNDREQVDLMATLWRDPEERARLGWSSWRDVLADPMKKDWDNAQVKFVVHLANLDSSLAEELFDELMRGKSKSPEPHVNAVAQVVAERARWAAERLLSRKPPQTVLALNAVAKIGPDFAAGLDHATRLRMIDWLRSARPRNPRAVWPTQFILAAADLDTHRLLLEQLQSAQPEPTVLIGVIQSISHLTPLHALASLAADIRELVNAIKPRANSPATEKLRIRARLEGRLAESDADARLWIQQQIVAGTSPSVAGTVVKTLADTHPNGPPGSMAAWMVTLLHTPHTDAAERLTQLLIAAPALDTESLGPLIHTAIDRMRAAADNHEDSRLHRSLLNLVIKLDKAQPTSEPEVRAIYEIVRSRLASSDSSPSDRPAALRDLSTLSGALMARHTDSGTVRDLIGDVLTGPRAAHLGKKLTGSVASLLFSILGRDPDAPTWLTSIFGALGTPLDIKLAIAKALLQFEGNKPGGYASALKDRPDCPAEVTTLIVPRLQS